MRGHFLILRCYENEIFDANLLECIFQIPETTTEHITTTTSVTTTTTTEPTTPKPVNPCEGITYGKKI